MGEFKNICCQFCGNCYNYEDELKHSLCKDYYEFILDFKIENMREQLNICLRLRQQLLLKAQ